MLLLHMVSHKTLLINVYTSRSMGENLFFLVLYPNDMLLACNDFSLLHATKHFVGQNFDMKDMNGTSYVAGI